jgi:hypothetical protein
MIAAVLRTHQEKCSFLEKTYRNLRRLELLEKADQVTSSNKKGIFNAFFFGLFSSLKK